MQTPSTAIKTPNHNKLNSAHDRRSTHKDQQVDPRFYPAPDPPDQSKISQQLDGDGNPTPRKSKTKYSSNPPEEYHVGWIKGASSTLSLLSTGTGQDGQRSEAGQSFGQEFDYSSFQAQSSQLSTSLSSTPQSLPKFEHPSHALLKENNFVSYLINLIRFKLIII